MLISKIWDTKGEGKRPIHTIPSPASVSRVGWKPGGLEIAACFITDWPIMTWELSRPFVPSRILESSNAVVTGTFESLCKRFSKDLMH
jgi:hypothetical protein